MNLLTGGALIDSFDNSEPKTPSARFSVRDRILASSAAALAFNVLTLPHSYWVLSQLPGTGLGRVVYKSLRNSSPLPKEAWGRVNAAFTEYQKQQSYSREIWTPALAEWQAFGILPLQGPTSQLQFEPLRLPLLAPDLRGRDEIIAKLNCVHLGASPFYGTTLPHVSHVPEHVRTQGPFPNAKALADKLFTLPTHKLVTEEEVRATMEQMRL